MKEYKFYATVTVGTYTTVEADSLAEAKDIASQRSDMMSVSSNNGDTPEEVWMIDELDGTPFNIESENE